MSSLVKQLHTALEQHRAGRLEDAQRGYRKIVRVDPGHADALHLLGLIAHQQGDYNSAIESISKALLARPRAAVYHCNLGAAYRAKGQPDESLKSFEESVRLDPKSAEAQFNLGLTFRGLHRYDEAATSMRHAVELDPGNLQTHHNLGLIYNALEKPDDALACFLKAVEIDPDDTEARYSAGTTLMVIGRPDEAIPHLQHALLKQPDFADARNWLGRALHDTGQLHESAIVLQRAIADDPDNIATHLNLGNAFISSRQLEEASRCFERVVDLDNDCLAGWTNLANVFKTQQKLDEAEAAYRNVLRLDPGQPLGELWLATLCPLIFQSNQEIDSYRKEFRKKLGRFAAKKLELDLTYFDARASVPPSHLQYHGANDRPLLEQFSHLFRYSFTADPPARRQGKPRVGIVVTSGHEGVFARSQGSIIERVNSDLFETVVVCSPTGAEAMRANVNCESIGILTMPYRFEKIVDTIREARFDVLYFWETGSDVTNYYLPFCRLAPVQCVGPGNSGTSGIPAIDYYLSPGIQETDDADKHYTETLIRMRTLESYQKRVQLPQHPKQRAEFGFTNSQHLYVCAQKIQKVHPDFDHVLADILRKDKRGTVVLVQDKSGIAAEMLKRRFASSIGDVADRISFLPRLNFDDYLSLTSMADVLLDPIYYGGGMTLYDWASLNKLLVTWPSRFLRGRYAYGFYKKMEISSCVAETLDDYVSTAVALGTDRLHRSGIEAEMRAASDVIFEDMAIVREYERVMQMLIEISRSR